MEWTGKPISYLGRKIWNMVPEEMKQKSSLFAFKREIKQWVLNNCPCVDMQKLFTYYRVYLTPVLLLLFVVVFCLFWF